MFSVMLIILTVFFKPRPAIKPWMLLVWASAFLGVGFGLIEYAVWLGGENLFSIALFPNIPLLAFFLVWIVFLIWLFEKHEKRKVWLALLAVLLFVVAIAVSCMDCLRL